MDRIKLDIQRFADGEIVIGTRVDNSGLQKGLKETEKMAKDFDKNNEIEPKVNVNTKEFEKALKDIDKRIEDKEIKIHYEYDKPEKGIVGAETFYETELVDTEKLIQKENAERRKQAELINQANQNLQQVNQTQEQLNNKIVETPNFNEVYEFDSVVGYTEQISLLERKLNDMIADYNMMASEENFNEQSQDALELAQNIEMTTNKIETLKRKQAELNGGFGNVSKEIDKIGNKIGGIIGKVGRWALAIVGVRTAMTLISSAFSTLSSYNDVLANKMANIRLTLAVGLEPVINRILSLVVTLLHYLNYLTTAWFGLNLFARASELSTQKIADNMSGAAGSAAEMRKQLAGFDEMNVLGDNVGSAGGGGGGKIKTPDFDLGLEDVKIPSWLEWIKNNGQAVALILGAIGAALLGIKLAPFLAALTGASTPLAAFAAGIALIAAGVVLLVGEIINLVLNWGDMDEKQRALAIGLAALGAAMIALGVAMATGFSAATLGLGVLVAGIVAAIAWLGTLIGQHISEAKAINDTTWYQKQYNQAKEDAKKATDDYMVAIENEEETQRKLNEAQQLTSSSAEELNKKLIEGTINYKDLSAEDRNLLKAYRDHIAASEDVAKKTEKMKEENLNLQLQTALTEKDYKKYGETLKKGMDDGTMSSKKMNKQLIKDMKGMDDQARLTFVQNLPKEIKNAFDWNNYGYKLDEFSRNWNDYIKRLEKNIEIKGTIKFRMMTGDTSGKAATGGILSVPKLASGAVINQPGRGIPLAGGAIAGEAGREGILPLTDRSAMETLGKEIGKWITINASIPVSVGNRQIVREVRQLMAQDDFATNS